MAPVYLGKQKGFFARRHIDLTLQPAEGGTETIPSVLSGNQQFGFSNVVTLLLAQAQGLPVKAGHQRRQLHRRRRRRLRRTDGAAR